MNGAKMNFVTDDDTQVAEEFVKRLETVHANECAAGKAWEMVLELLEDFNCISLVGAYQYAAPLLISKHKGKYILIVSVEPGTLNSELAMDRVDSMGAWLSRRLRCGVVFEVRYGSERTMSSDPPFSCEFAGATGSVGGIPLTAVEVFGPNLNERVGNEQSTT
jgi:hypothetical protein